MEAKGGKRGTAGGGGAGTGAGVGGWGWGWGLTRLISNGLVQEAAPACVPRKPHSYTRGRRFGHSEPRRKSIDEKRCQFCPQSRHHTARLSCSEEL